MLKENGDEPEIDLTKSDICRVGPASGGGVHRG